MSESVLSPAIAEAQRVLRAEAQAVLNVIPQLNGSFEQAVETIAACTGMVVVSGMGKSGLIGTKLSATLASTGTPSHFLHPAEAMHGDLGRIRKSDIVLLLSYGGESEEVLSLAALVRQDSVKVISITGKRESHLARISDIHLCVGDVTEACPHNLAPTASTTAILALGDALAMAVMNRKAFSAADFRKSHPGGALGRQMMPVLEMLRFKAGQNLALVDESHPIEVVLTEAIVPGRRAGAVLLVNSEGRLSGIFTDADLRRLLTRDGPAMLKRPVREVMTANPRRLRSDAVIRDAVQLVRELRVDEIPIVDPDNRPLGLLDVQDLIALKLIEE